jgi:hypothetical protein
MLYVAFATRPPGKFETNTMIAFEEIVFTTNVAFEDGLDVGIILILETPAPVIDDSNDVSSLFGSPVGAKKSLPMTTEFDDHSETVTRSRSDTWYIELPTQYPTELLPGIITLPIPETLKSIEKSTPGDESTSLIS